MKRAIGDRSSCRYCGHDIEYQGNRRWADRGNGTSCLPYEDRKLNEIVRPKTRHRPEVSR